MTARKHGLIAVLCILFLLLGGCAEESPIVGLPAQTALTGAASGTEAGFHMAVVPAAILEKVSNRPDTMAYAADFYYCADRDWDTDISADVIKGEVPLFLQWDKRWGYELYGENYMGINGCGPTALAMVYAGLTGNADQSPYDIAQYAEAGGLYIAGLGTKWELMETGGRELGLRVQRLWKDENGIRNALAEGKLLTVRVGEGDFTDSGHFLVVCGIDANDMLTIRDPNSREKTEQLWEFQCVLEQSSCWWSFGL